MTWRLPVCHIHAPTGERMATLSTAHDISRSYKRMEQGEAQVSISSRDPQANLDTLRLGNLLVIESPDYPPWVGPITQPKESSESGMIDIGALGLASLLDGHITPQSEAYTTSTGSGAIVASIVRGANRQGPTGIGLPAILPTGPAVSDLSIGGQSCLEALNELADRSFYEWWIDVSVTPYAITATLRWGLAQGEDYSASMHLYERQHLVTFNYGLDLGQLKSAVSVLGGSSSLADRAAVMQAVGTGNNSSAQLVDERIRRQVLSYGAPATQRVVLDPTTTNPSELARRGKRNQERGLTAAETIELIVNRNADWRKLWLGNYVTANARTTLGGDLSRVVRIVAAQPSEESGVTNLGVEIALL